VIAEDWTVVAAIAAVVSAAVAIVAAIIAACQAKAAREQAEAATDQAASTYRAADAAEAAVVHAGRTNQIAAEQLMLTRTELTRSESAKSRADHPQFEVIDAALTALGVHASIRVVKASGPIWVEITPKPNPMVTGLSESPDPVPTQTLEFSRTFIEKAMFDFYVHLGPSIFPDASVSRAQRRLQASGTTMPKSYQLMKNLKMALYATVSVDLVSKEADSERREWTTHCAIDFKFAWL
jgi:cell division protein FtsL